MRLLFPLFGYARWTGTVGQAFQPDFRVADVGWESLTYGGLMNKGTGTASNSGLTGAKIQDLAEPVPFFIRLDLRCFAYAD